MWRSCLFSVTGLQCTGIMLSGDCSQFDQLGLKRYVYKGQFFSRCALGALPHGDLYSRHLSAHWTCLGLLTLLPLFSFGGGKSNKIKQNNKTLFMLEQNCTSVLHIWNTMQLTLEWHKGWGADPLHPLAYNFSLPKTLPIAYCWPEALPII